MPIVSLYPHIKEVHKGETIELHDIIETMGSDHWRPKIEHLRMRVSEGASKEEIDKLKSKIPYFTASGRFNVRNNTGLIEHSGKLAIDFDKLEDIPKAWAQVINDKYTQYAFLSCTGRGICAIVDIDPSKHLESFLFLEKYYKECYGLELDEACKDVSRPRYISWQPDIFQNENYFKVELPRSNDFNSGIAMEEDSEKYVWAKDVIFKKHGYKEGDRHRVLVILAFFLNKCGVSEAYALDQYLKNFVEGGNDEKEIGRIIRDCYKNTVEHGTFVINKKVADLPEEFQKSTKEIYAAAHLMNKTGRKFTEENLRSLCNTHLLSMDIVKGIFKYVFEKFADEFNLDEQPDIYKVELFIKRKYFIVKNEINQRYEYRPADQHNETMQRLSIDTIYRELQYCPDPVIYKFALDKLKSLLRSDYIPIYNPFKTYFDNLPQYDPSEIDYIEYLASFVKTDNQEFWKVQFKKALVRSIACSLDNKENRIIIVLVEQNQNTGKTNFIRFLCPPFLREYYTESTMDNSKDSDLQLSENFIWNLEELSALNNVEVNKLKAIISKSTVKQRRAYAEFADSNPRRVNFWASTNKSEFLTDDQNTRWLCFNVQSIDHDYNNFRTGIKKVSIDNVWAQAYHLYKSDFDCQLTIEEAAQRDQNNKIYELSSVEKDLIQRHYKVCGVREGEFMTCTDILLKLQEFTEQKIKMNLFAVSKAMKQLSFVPGFKKTNGKTQRGYWLKELDTLLVPEQNFNVTERPTDDKTKTKLF
jgi:hypothetical protein